MFRTLMNRSAGFATIIQGLVLLGIVVMVGITGFIYIENYSFVEAFFMTVITLSTVGFREVKTLSPDGMVFTSVLIVTSFGLFAYVISTITRYILDGGFRDYYKIHLVNKRLAKISNHVIVCGYGRNGKQAVEELLQHDEKVVIIETQEGLLQEIHQSNPDLIYVNGDATHDETLERAKIEQAKALITTLPSDANNLFVVLSARQLNPALRIISRASEDQSDVKIKRAGADNVIMSDKIGGARMAKLVAQPDIIEFLETLLLRSQEGVNLVEIFCKDISSCFINKTIAELDIRRISGANLIGLKDGDGNFVFNPSAHHVIKPDDKLFALGTPEQIKKLKRVLGGVEIK